MGDLEEFSPHGLPRVRGGQPGEAKSVNGVQVGLTWDLTRCPEIAQPAAVAISWWALSDRKGSAITVVMVEYLLLSFRF